MGTVGTHCQELCWDTPNWFPESKLADSLKKVNPADLNNDASRVMHYYAGALKRFVMGDGDGGKIEVISSWPEWEGKLWKSDYYHSKNLGGDTFDYRYPDADGLLLGRLVKNNKKTRFVREPTRLSNLLSHLYVHNRTVERAFNKIVSSRLFF